MRNSRLLAFLVIIHKLKLAKLNWIKLNQTDLNSIEKLVSYFIFNFLFGPSGANDVTVKCSTLNTGNQPKAAELINTTHPAIKNTQAYSKQKHVAP